MKRILKSGFALLLALLMVLPVLASCSGSKKPSGESVKTTEADGQNTNSGNNGDNGDGEVEEVEVLPDVNYNGRDFRILMRDNDYYYHDMEVEDEVVNASGASKVDQAVYYRNRTVEKRLGVTIKVDRQSGYGNSLNAAGVRAALRDGSYDLIADHGRSLFTYVMEGSFKNWYDLKWVDLTKSWWSQGMISDFSIQDNLWCLTGDLSYQGIGATVAMVMNKKLQEELMLDDPYSAVLNNTWTLEMFSEMVEAAKTDTDNGDLSPENGDMTGYMTSQWRGPMTSLYSAGVRAVKLDEDGMLQITVNTPKTILLFDDYFKLLDRNNCKLYLGNMPGNFHKTFANGNVLFMDTRLYDIGKVIENGFLDYGILPWPKYDEEVDEYYAWVDAVANVFGIPTNKTDEDYEFISAVLEALAAEGQRRVIPDFYEDTIQKRYAQDPESFRALELIRAGRVFDLATYMADDTDKLSRVGYDLAGSNTNYSTWWGKNGTSLQKKIDDANTKLKNLIAKSN